MSSEPPAPRGIRPGPGVVVLLLALPVLVLFSEALFGPEILSPTDALLAFQPWRSVAPDGYRPENPVLLDQALLVRPWLEFAAERVRAGELPLWNPYNFCGQPITAAVTGATYWPLHWVYYAFPTPEYHGAAAALRVVLSGLFTWCFLRRLGVSAGPGAVGACVFMLSGFMVAWLGHPHTNAALCLPLLLWQVERLAERPSGRRTALLAACVALPLVGGHLQTATHVLLATGAYALFRTRVAVAAPALGLPGLARFAAAGLLGCLLAAPQLVPFVEYYLASMGKDLLDAFDTTSPFDRLLALRLMVLPDSLGGPHTGDYTGPSGFNLNYNELIGGFVGRLPLLLAAWQLGALRRSRAGRFFFGLALLGALVSWRVFPFYEAARSVPLLRSTKLARLSLFVAFGLAVLAAQGLDRLVRRAPPRARTPLWLAAFAVVAADLVHWGRGYNPAIPPERIAPESPLTRFLARDASLYRVLGVDNSILLPNANIFHKVPMVSGYDSIEYRPMAELVARMANEPLLGFEEILGRSGGALPEAGFIKEIRVFDRLEALPLASLLGVKYLLSEAPLPPPLLPAHEGPVLAYENPGVLPRAFVAEGWVAIEDPAERLDHLGSSDFEPRVAVLERPAPEPWLGAGPAGGGAGEVAVEAYEPRRVRLAVRLEQPGLVVLADAWDPGWRAVSGGRELPVERVDHALRGLFLPAGEHEVELSYTPASTRAGFLLGGGAFLACLLLALRSRGGNAAERTRDSG